MKEKENNMIGKEKTYHLISFQCSHTTIYSVQADRLLHLLSGNFCVKKCIFLLYNFSYTIIVLYPIKKKKRAETRTTTTMSFVCENFDKFFFMKYNIFVTLYQYSYEYHF